MIATKRAYEPYAPSDGYRVLIDRLWPRGVSKADAHLDAWDKDIAPSRALREWYEHDPAKWPEFRKRYLQELKAPAAQAALDDLVRRARRGRVTLVYASRATDISDVAVLQQLLDRRLHQSRARSAGTGTRTTTTRSATKGGSERGTRTRPAKTPAKRARSGTRASTSRD